MGIKGEISGTICVTFTWDMYIYIWVVYSLCFFCCLFITVTWWYVWCIEWASGNQEEVQACLVTLWLFIISCYSLYKTLRWRYNDHAGVSNHRPHGCLLNRLFRHRSKKTSKLRVAGLCVGNSPGPVTSPHKGPVTRKMFPFDDVIMPL